MSPLIRTDEDWLSTIGVFQSAGVGAQSWETALEGFAQATGSRSAQLTGVDSNASVLFNVITNIDPLVHILFPATAGINPRVKAAHEAPVLRILADADFITPEDSRRDRFYQEVARPLDVPFICMTTLERQEDSFIALASVRSKRDGHITREQREIFAALAPHVRSAVRTHRALEGHGGTVLTGAMEALSIPAFVCDRSGRVKSLTLAAEALVTSGLGLQLKAGQLLACEPDDAKALANAIDAALVRLAVVGPPILRTVIVRGRDRDATPLVLDVFPLPVQPYQFSFDPRVMIVARGARGSKARRAAFLQSAYALTSAETEIAQILADGQSTDSIAAERGVAVGTVRAQIKTIMAKIGVSRQVELVVRLSQL
jgi:DNA-binding CsgD family transcriptional regulator